jgi:hypothetical protein
MRWYNAEWWGYANTHKIMLMKLCINSRGSQGRMNESRANKAARDAWKNTFVACSLVRFMQISYFSWRWQKEINKFITCVGCLITSEAQARTEVSEWRGRESENEQWMNNHQTTMPWNE